MAESSSDSIQDNKDGDKKKKNVLEEKSKEDLVKLVKKYLSLLQKAKNKTDELTEKCCVLEKERNAAVEDHQSTERELLNKIAELQQSVSKLTAEKGTLDEKDQEISELKKKLTEAEDNKSHGPSQRENEEQMQCLTLQLQSLKASCQCIQEENTKLQKLNEEKSNQIKFLTDERNNLLSDVEKKIEQYTSVLNEKNDIKEKYEKLVEKNRSLFETGKLPSKSMQKKNSAHADKIQILEEECQTLRNEIDKIREEKENLNKEKESLLKHRDSDALCLVAHADKIQILQEECQTLKNEIDEIKEEKENLYKEKENLLEERYSDASCLTAQDEVQALEEKCQSLKTENHKIKEDNENLRKENEGLLKQKDDDVSIFLRDIEKYQQEIKKLEEENRHLKNSPNKHFDVDSLKKETKPEYRNEQISPEVSKEISDLKSSKLVLEEKVEEVQSELETYHLKNAELEEEIKRLASLLEPNDYKTGIELALLQGASTEGLVHSGEMHSSTAKKILHTTTEEKQSYESIEGFSYGFGYELEESSGLEYALLQGGDVTGFAANNSVNQINDVLLPNNDAKELHDKIEKLDQNVKFYQENLQKYSTLYSESLEENKDLKKQLDELKSNKNIMGIDKGINTDLDKTDKFSCEKEISTSSKTNEYENYMDLCKEIYSLYETIASKRNVKSDKMSKNEPLEILKQIEDLYLDVVKNLELKMAELNEHNLQLELLVIGMKQGVRQKTSTTTYQTEKKLEENICLLKVLLDDLITRSNSHISQIKNLESDFAAERKKLEDELLQLKELNQFLEDENTELNNEVEKLKCSLNKDDDENFDNGKYYGENYQRSPELYSIDESNEVDEKSDVNEGITDENMLHQENITICDYSTQTTISTNDFSVQVEPELYLLNQESKLCNSANVIIQTDEKIEDIQSKIEQLKEENKSLKEAVKEKSNLVEQIHCQMDSLLTKNEELSVELKEKEDDLKHSQCLNADLKNMLTDIENIKKQQADAFRIAQSTILDFKAKNNYLNEDMKSFNISFKELIGNVNNNLTNVIKQNCQRVDDLTEKCYHKENNLSIIREWLNDFSKDFVVWYNFIDQVACDSSNQSLDFFENLDMTNLEKTIKTPSDRFSLFEVLCDQDSCCLISENIKHLNFQKFNLFSKFYDHLHSNYVSLIKDINQFKGTVIPKMEKTIADLEKKISECTCQNNSKEEKNVADHLQSEESESLKNQLTEAEIKMTKFKQIALKLKKELAQTKEQFNESIAEKENLQKQNTKLLEEFNKISDDHCKYVQNYQSLQTEFDKLQDDCELYKGNIKKLEEGLGTKLNELTASKEQVTELESQLNVSKQLNESNLSIRKELDAKCADLEGKVIVLESKINEKTQKINLLENDIAKHLKDLNSALDENKHLKNQLQVAQKEGKKKNLLDLEMADYERSITELNNQIQRKDDEIDELQNELKCMKEKVDTLQEEIKSTETLKETEVKRAENLKEIVEKTKAELKKVQDHETELLTKSASLRIQLETLTQQEEDHKLQMSEASVQIQRFQDIIKTSTENHQRIVKSFEQKVANQKQEILLAHKEVEAVKQEFENYKIRVHSVLKQQKTVTPAITTVDADLKEKLEAMNEKLKLQVTDLSEKLTAVSLEYETLQEEHESLLQRYNKVIEDQQEKDKEWHQRLELVNAEKNRLRATQEELSSQHLLQNEMLVATYKKQIKIMSEEHKRLVSDLQKQLDAADIEISRLQRDQQKLQGLPVTPLPPDNSTPFDIFSQERQEGEGSESTEETNTPVRHLSLATIPTSGFLSFEKLIQSPIEPGTPASYISTADSEKLTADLTAANKKLDHLSELLNDSESTNLRLSEQVRVLKDEVRRLENNKERERHAENLEYLKNVFIKFASLQPGSEKAMLIPVLTTMLKLSPDEQQQLKSVAGDLDTGDSSNSGWSSYLHRWSGLS